MFCNFKEKEIIFQMKCIHQFMIEFVYVWIYTFVQSWRNADFCFPGGFFLFIFIFLHHQIKLRWDFGSFTLNIYLYVLNVYCCISYLVVGSSYSARSHNSIFYFSSFRKHQSTIWILKSASIYLCRLICSIYVYIAYRLNSNNINRLSG